MAKKGLKSITPPKKYSQIQELKNQKSVRTKSKEQKNWPSPSPRGIYSQQLSHRNPVSTPRAPSTNGVVDYGTPEPKLLVTHLFNSDKKTPQKDSERNNSPKKFVSKVEQELEAIQSRVNSVQRRLPRSLAGKSLHLGKRHLPAHARPDTSIPRQDLAAKRVGNHTSTVSPSTVKKACFGKASVVKQGQGGGQALREAQKETAVEQDLINVKLARLVSNICKEEHPLDKMTAFGQKRHLNSLSQLTMLTKQKCLDELAHLPTKDGSAELNKRDVLQSIARYSFTNKATSKRCL